MQLFTLAENFDLPIQKLCLRSLLRHNPNAIIFTKESIRSIPGGSEFLDQYNHLSMVHFSDIFRMWYIYSFGGAWIDADCIHLREMEHPNTSKLSILYADFACHNITQTYTCGHKGDPFLALLLERQSQLIRDKGAAGLQYLDLGEWSINHIRATQNGNELLNFLPHWEHCYIAWYNTHYFHGQKHWGDFQFDRGLFNPNAYCYHLSNRIISEFAHFPEKDLLDHKYFLSFLLRRAVTNGFEGCKDLAILSRLPEVGGEYRYAEVGVYKGYSTSIIGQQRTNAHIYAIDPWANHANDDYRATGDYIAWNDNTEHEQSYQEYLAHNWFLLSQQRLTTNRNTSANAARDYKDKYFDMVFIDGDHSESAVINDINSWYPKVKSGGWLGGHDYRHPGFNSGVHLAVDAFISKSGLDLELDGDYTWFIRVP